VDREFYCGAGTGEVVLQHTKAGIAVSVYQQFVGGCTGIICPVKPDGFNTGKN